MSFQHRALRPALTTLAGLLILSAAPAPSHAQVGQPANALLNRVTALPFFHRTTPIGDAFSAESFLNAVTGERALLGRTPPLGYASQITDRRRVPVDGARALLGKPAD